MNTKLKLETEERISRREELCVSEAHLLLEWLWEQRQKRIRRELWREASIGQIRGEW